MALPAGAATTVKVPASITVEPGQEFQATISVTNAVGVYGYYFELGHSSRVEFVRAAQQRLFAAGLEGGFVGVNRCCLECRLGQVPEFLPQRTQSCLNSPGEVEQDRHRNAAVYEAEEAKIEG